MIPVATRKTFPSIGRCIYCGSTDRLQREHIIPYCLGGDYLFTDGSCESCREETHAFEGKCAGLIFGPVRLAHKFPSRHKKQRKTHIDVEVESGGESKTLSVPIDEVPTSPVVVPILEPPGILVGREPSDKMPVICLHVALPVPDDHKERLLRLRQGGPTRINVRFYFAVDPFMRLLAKIAHGLAVAAHGPDTFKPLLPDYILGRDNRFAHVIGGTPLSIIGDQLPHGWTVGMRHLADGRHYVNVLVQLFSYLKLPVYEVIAGEASPDLVRHVLSRSAPPAGS